jgi:hypothetical protein
MATTYTLNATSRILDASNTELAKLPTVGIDATITQHVDDQIQIPNGSTDLSISFVGLTAKYIHLEFSGGDVSVKLNSSSNTAIAIEPSAAVPGVLLLAGGAITSIFVTNASGSVVTMKRILAS